jgi:cell wall-associated NlpC family hydrolase
VLRHPALLTAAAAALAVFLAPLPAHAAPVAAPGDPIGVPDAGSRPTPIGAIRLPGTGIPQANTPVATVATTPLLAKVEKKREQVAALGDRLLDLREQQAVARQQAATVDARHTAAQQALTQAETEAAAAAAASLRESAGTLPDEFGSDLHGLGTLSRLQRGEATGRSAAARHLAIAREAFAAVDAEKKTAGTRTALLDAEYGRLDAEFRKEQAALAKLERDNAEQLAADERASDSLEQNLGQQYLAGGDLDGKGAHPKALEAMRHALAQLGDMYLWAAEGPDRFDCSGLMLYSYLKTGYTKLPRVSRYQYNATRANSVDRSQLLPGDLLFFSSSSSWTDIHHVAMYIGDGEMVEAPRSGVPVRVATVRWSRLFAATRIYGAVDKPTPPRPKPPTSPATPPPTTTPPTTSPTTSPTPSPTTSPTPSPTTSSPTPEPTGSSGSPSPSPSGSTTTPSPNPGPTSARPSPSAGTSGAVSGSASGSPSRSASKSPSRSPSKSASAGGSGSASP